MKRKKDLKSIMPFGVIVGIIVLGIITILTLPKKEAPVSQRRPFPQKAAPVEAEPVAKPEAQEVPKGVQVVKAHPPDADKLLAKAVAAGNKEKIPLLIEEGADVNLGLVKAVEGGDMEMVRYFVEREGASVEKADHKRSLLIAAAKSNARLLKYLIRKGANVNAVDKGGRTPLHAVLTTDEKGVYAKARILVRKGAAVDVADKRGRTPLAMAEKTDNKRLIKLLSKNAK